MLWLLLVDDHPVYAQGLRALLEQRLRQARILCAADGRSALALLQQHPGVDLVISDQRLPDQTGLALLADVARLQPQAARLLMSGQDDPRLPLAAREAGCAGFIHKTTPPDGWVRALQAVLVGEPWFDPVPQPALQASLPALPPRAREALAPLVQGLSNREISQHMGIGERAVKQHLSAAFAALGADSRARAIVLARQHGLGGPAAPGP